MSQLDFLKCEIRSVLDYFFYIYFAFAVWAWWFDNSKIELNGFVVKFYFVIIEWRVCPQSQVNVTIFETVANNKIDKHHMVNRNLKTLASRSLGLLEWVKYNVYWNCNIEIYAPVAWEMSDGSGKTHSGYADDTWRLYDKCDQSQLHALCKHAKWYVAYTRKRCNSCLLAAHL